MSEKIEEIPYIEDLPLPELIKYEDVLYSPTSLSQINISEGASVTDLVANKITATSGDIGGWSISAAALYKDGATDSVSAGMAPADYPFYAGAKYANRATAPFRVTPAGAITATSATITGSLTTGVGSAIDGQYLGNLTIATGALANLAVTAGKIDNATITATQIASATITATQIAGLTITATEIANATITGTQIAAATITGSNIGATTIEAGNIANATITGTQIAATTIQAGNIASGTITTTEISGTAGIIGGQIADATLTAGNITNLTITAAQIANLTITSAQIASQTIIGGDSATDTGWKSPSATGGHYNNWTNPTYAYASDNSYTQPEDSTDEWWQSYETFDFAIPSGAIIGGIEVKVECNLSQADGDAGLSILIYSTSAGVYQYKSVPITTNEQYHTLGDSSDEWTTTWIDSDFSNTNFYLALAGSYVDGIPLVDHIQVKVHYTTIAGNIATNTIKGGATGNIALTSITADNIAASTITATQIAAHTITAGQIVSGTITAEEITVTNLQSLSVTTGALVVDSAGYIRGGQTAYNVGTGLFLGYDTDAYKLSIGVSTGNFLTWDGSALKIRGNIEREDIHWLTYFESKDGFESVIDNDGYVTVWGGHIKVGSGTVSGNETYFRKYHDYGSALMSWDKDRIIKTKVYFVSNTNQTIWITSGENGVGPHIGFKVLNGVLYGTVKDTVAESTLNLGNITATTAYELKVDFKAGSKATFYVDGVDEGNITTNLPSGVIASGYLIWLSATTGENAAKEIRLSYWDFWQSS